MESVVEQKIKPKVHDLSAFKQVMESRSHPLEMLREALSNMMAPEVNASKVVITHFSDPEFNSSFMFIDDGVGMTYTGDADRPGRLDRFLGLAFSKAAGLAADYWGWKGLGSKLMLNCSRLIVETWTGGENDPVFHAQVINPRQSLMSDPPMAPEYLLSQRQALSSDQRGTKITVKGYDVGVKRYTFEEIERYLYLNTAVGLTREFHHKPVVTLSVDGTRRDLPIGFQFITPQKNSDGTSSWRTVVIAEPITKEDETTDEAGKPVKVTVTLKGGFTLDTSEFGLSPHRRNTGLRLSIKGIPYFQLAFYEYKGNKFNQYKDLCSFVVECDALESKLNMDRSNISNQHGEDRVVQLFRRLTAKCFDELVASAAYKQFDQTRRKEDEKGKAKALRDRQEQLQDPNQEFVCIKAGADHARPIHRVPDGENDTLAIFWKLEALGLVPFAKFISLEHTNRAGIDVVATYQVDEESQLKINEAVEFEYAFENYIAHGHNPKQTSMIICWTISKPDKLKKINEYYFKYEVEDLSIPVYVINRFPGVNVKKNSEVDI